MKKKRCKKCSSWFVPEEETLACCDDCAREILNAIRREAYSTAFYYQIEDGVSGDVIETQDDFRSKRHAQESGYFRIQQLKDEFPFHSEFRCVVGEYTCDEAGR